MSESEKKKLNSFILFLRLGFPVTVFFFGISGCTLGPSAPEAEKPEVVLPVPVLIEVLPKQEDEAFKRDTKLTLKFSLPLDPKTLTVNQEDQQCTGTVQLSADDFKTCVRLEKPVAGTDRKDFVIAPKGIYQSGRRYRLRLMEGILGSEGGQLSETENPGEFRTYSTQQLGSPGNDRGMAMALDQQGQTYVAGITAKGGGTGLSDIFLAKFASDGRQLWIRQAGFEYLPDSCQLSLLSNGLIRVIAHHSGEESSKMVIADFNEQGEILWNRNYSFPGKSFGSAVGVDEDLNLISSGSWNAPLVSIGPKGILAWRLNLKGRVRFEEIAVTEKLHFYAAGNVTGDFDGHSSLGKEDGILVKMHQSGIKRWSRRFGTDRNDQVVGLFDGESGVLVVLKTETSSAESKSFHTVLYRFDAEGEKIWERSLQGLLPGPALAVREIENGHLLLAGYGSDTQKLEEGSSSGSKDENAFAARLDQDGDLVWLEIFGGKGSERALAISETPAGNVYVTGYTTGSIDGSINEGKEDMFLVRINSEGKRF
ncbi:MAG: hypothetical protein VW777_05605 [Deltaproteobacteria bacterium]